MGLDFDAVRAGLASAIPFNAHNGLELIEVAPGRGVVVAPDADHGKNHIGSQHAAALFGAGEFASGAAFLGAFGEHLAGLIPLAQSAEIAYRKVANGPITATATLDADVSELLAQVEADGRTRFPVAVVLRDGGGDVVAEMTVRWYVKRAAA
ncbi:DUF4442 domain-containing protein [Conexibacter stalactiti]|uniref:DUF4442 domain-containing protein n=1 Tax=Conexibacter stalactiti TaxID=1940611 RepID=A0ABU4HLK1_9ACTN|nr:DUF4442 domain-containing protein [Conexibacter stalactiti]MDW5593602.1 DUF4442 domain-containing protein [Conexibacter stalactiti]MEC5034243.1 DUF4442 domain-containing protein [Conexibacter stalactiti]